MTKPQLEASVKELVDSNNDYLRVIEKVGVLRIQCKLTEHQMLPRLSDIEQHLKSKKFIKQKEWYCADFSRYEPAIIQYKKNPNKLFCKITKQILNKIPEEVEKHIQGRRFKRMQKEKLERKKAYEERQERKQQKIIERQNHYQNAHGEKKVDDDNNDGNTEQILEQLDEDDVLDDEEEVLDDEEEVLDDDEEVLDDDEEELDDEEEVLDDDEEVLDDEDVVDSDDDDEEGVNEGQDDNDHNNDEVPESTSKHHDDWSDSELYLKSLKKNQKPFSGQISFSKKQKRKRK